MNRDNATSRPVLRFNPYAWSKLLFLRDIGSTEVGAFGISASDDPLIVEDVQLVKQQCTPVSVLFADGGVADFFDRQVDQGLSPQRFARLWLHTHPGNSALPSATDEATFDRVFGESDWAVMAILARGGQTYARLALNVGPGGSIQMPVEVDYSRTFMGSREAAWEEEYLAFVQEVDERVPLGTADFHLPEQRPSRWLDAWQEYTLGYDEEDFAS